ncbi:MAG: MerR family transcriptional regulator [Chloroflexota bacterium]
MTRENDPRYVISVAAKLVGVETYTLRYYERVGLIEPSRSKGNIRLYSEKDIEVLRRMKSLMDDMGVNLAGVEVILRMLEHLSGLQREVMELTSELEKLREAGKNDESESG